MRLQDLTPIGWWIAFATKGEMAWAQIEAALAAGIPRGTVLVDAAYGDEAALRDRLSAHGLSYAVGIRPATAVWWDAYQPAPAPAQEGRGRRRSRVVRDATRRLACVSWPRRCRRPAIAP